MSDSLRILFVCSGDFRSPPEKQVLSFAAELAAAGHTAAVSLGGDPATVDDEAFGPAPAVWRHRYAGRRLARASRRRAEAFRPSLVHAFNARLPVVRAAASYARDSGVPLLVHFEDDEWGLRRARPEDPPLRRVARGAGRAAAELYTPAWPFATRGTLRAARVEASALDGLTAALCQEVTARLGRPCREIQPPAPTEDGVAQQPSGLEGIPEDHALVAYTGGVFGAHLADFELAVAAVGRLRAEGRPVAFVQIGRSAPRFDLPALARSHGLGPDSAAFLGYRPWAEVRGLMARAVLVQPGAPNDFNRLRLPSKLPGYLRSGTPTVTFAVGAGEMLVDREEVLKTHTGDPAELAERIAELLDDASLRATLSERGPEAAQRLFEPRMVTARLLDHYHAVLEG